ncbi:GDSL esterase/lipase [Dichanthelium oligosanthes]|uniref:GDSL esterase/lipase n=1 Tax=Dichanthelium oligosanthes TaxID=888268 RepID=A0A1E5VKE1_9POAL|nr:GDSL esterase/lipase [Dichanthelium oligosanthes]
MVGYTSATVLCLLVVSSSVQVMVAAAAAGAARPPAMFVFGDSTLDVGNNNFLPGPDVPRANKPYYGIDFPGSVPTGRFSNGYNIADYLAKHMGFALSPAPYLSLAPSTSRLVQAAVGAGVSYASGGAGVLDSTVSISSILTLKIKFEFESLSCIQIVEQHLNNYICELTQNAGNNIPLSKQLQYFKFTKSQMVAKLGSRAANLLLAKSVFLFSVGSNDLFVFATAEPKRNKSAAGQQRDVAALYASLVSGYSAAVEELHALGARKFAVINVGLLGCVPAARLHSATGECADGLNQLASGLNDALASLVAGLASRLPGFAYSLADYYGLSEATFDDPGAVGYTDITGACCGGGRLGAEADCLPNATVCSDRDQHAFWDAVHPSQRGAMLTAQNFYNSRPGRYTAPIDFKHLAQTSL